jgi:4-diphosphocytidyl-2-C-methyl-D-erythritol kinase
MVPNLFAARWHATVAVLQRPPTRWQPAGRQIVRADPMILTETARAKVNLTLRVRGRRPDGYHALESIVAFAEIGDRLTFDPRAAPGVTLEGPFAAEVDPADNLVAHAVAAAVAGQTDLVLGHITLEKRLPVAAGIGGGSADAAATLRLMQRANPHLETAALLGIAARLGADVPVCVHDRAAVMTGTGSEITALAAFPPLPAVLANSMVQVPANKTAAVFKALASPPLMTTIDHAAVASQWSGRHTTASLLDALAGEANDLEAPARQIMPDIGAVLAELAVEPGARLVRLSGAGPTGFALFDTIAAANAAAAELRARRPRWWIAATVLQ